MRGVQRRPLLAVLLCNPGPVLFTNIRMAWRENVFLAYCNCPLHPVTTKQTAIWLSSTQLLTLHDYNHYRTLNTFALIHGHSKCLAQSIQVDVRKKKE